MPASKMSPIARLAPRYLTSLPRSRSAMSFFTTETLSDTPFTATTCQHAGGPLQHTRLCMTQSKATWRLPADVRLQWSHIPAPCVVRDGLGTQGALTGNARDT